jgi:phosphoglycolate phosphatase-like HAD superfamily hydrolase
VSRIALVSFDIDGTLEIGEPPGIVTVAAMQMARRLGYVMGTCSDRPVAHQRQLWERLGLTPDFIALKHRLAEVKASFAAAAYYHIGDTDVDAHFAGLAGFQFLRADAASFRAWGPALFPGARLAHE